MLHHVFPKSSSIADTLGNIFRVAAGRAWTRNIQDRHTSRVSGSRHISRIALATEYAVSDATSISRASGSRSPLEVRVHPSDLSGSKIARACSSEASVYPPLSRRQQKEPPVSTDCGNQNGASSLNTAVERSDGIPAAPYIRVGSESLVASFKADGFADLEAASLPDPSRVMENQEFHPTNELVGVPTVQAGPLRTLPPPSLPHPKTPANLCQNLLFYLQYTRKPPNLPDLLTYHNSYPAMYSARSFNILIQLSLRHASFGTVQTLFSQMRHAGVEPDNETWKLWVRWMVRTGRWQEAWDELTQEEATPMPFPVWLEFLGSTHRRGFRTRDEKGKLVVATGSQPSSEDEAVRYACVMEYWPRVVVASDHRVQIQSHAIRAVVSALLRANSPSSALQIVRTYLETLSPPINKKERAACLDIVHQFLVFHPAKRFNFPAYLSLRDTLFSLLEHRPDLCLRPDSTTLFLLLRSLKRSHRCGTAGSELVAAFKQRWGPSVVDERVRRRLASFLAKEGHTSPAKDLLSQQKLLDTQRRMWKVQKEVVGGASGDKSRYRRLLRQKWKKTLVKRGKEAWKWRMLRRKLRTGRRRYSDDALSKSPPGVVVDRPNRHSGV